MAIGLVSDSEFELECDRLKSVPLVGSIEQIILGRKGNNPNTPDSLRKIISDESLTNGRQAALELANNFGVGKSSVSAYSVGATSTGTYNKPNQSLSRHLQKSKDRIALKAKSRLNLALEQITEEKLSGAKVTEIATVASSMSKIMKDMEPNNDNGNNNSNTPQIVIFAPQIRSESEYEVIEVKE